MNCMGFMCLYCGGDHEYYVCPNPYYHPSNSFYTNAFSPIAPYQEFTDIDLMTLDDMICRECGGRHWTFECQSERPVPHFSQHSHYDHTQATLTTSSSFLSHIEKEPKINSILERIIEARYDNFDLFVGTMQALFEEDSWKSFAPIICKLISLEELATLLGPSQEWVSRLIESLETLGRHEGVNEEIITSPFDASGDNDLYMQLEESTKVKDELVEKENKFVDHRVDLNSHEDKLEFTKENDEFEKTNVLYLNSFPGTLILENTNLEDTPQFTPEEKKVGEIEHEMEVKDVNFSSCFELIECLGADEYHEMYLEHIGYIIEFEPTPIYKFTPYQKPMILENRGIELKRIGPRIRNSEIWEWDTFPWDPGGKVNTKLS